jgi:hypothetical protein
MVFGLAPFVTASLLQLFASPPWVPRADEFRLLWEVEAVLLGLVVAVAVFGLQVILDTSLRVVSSTAGASFLAAIKAGLILVAGTGITATADADLDRLPWLRLEFSVLSVLWLGMLAVGLSEAIRSSSPRVVAEMLANLVAHMTKKRAANDIVRRAGSSAIADLVAAAGASNPFWFTSSSRGGRTMAVRTQSGGFLMDIHTARLSSGLHLAHANARVELVLRFMESISSEQVIARASGRVRPLSAERIRSSLYFEKSRDDKSQDLLGELHLVAVRSLLSKVSGLKPVLNAYQSALQHYAMVWTSVVPRLEWAHVDAGLRWDDGPVGQIYESVRDLLTQVSERSSRDDVYSLSYFPIGVAQRAVEWRAPAYFQLLDLYPLMYRIAPIVGGSQGAALKDRSWRHLIEALWLLLPRYARDDGLPIDVDVLRQAQDRVRRALGMLLDAAISAGDVTFAADVIQRWRRAERDDG